MVVDDSAVIRGFLTKILETNPNIKVQSSAQNGEIAINNLARHPHDIIILDVEMPVMGGLEAIPKLLKIQPGVKIIMCSTLTSENAQTSLKAMELGAVDCIAKPSSTQDMYSKDTFRDILTHTVLSIAGFNEERKNNSSSSKQTSSAPATSSSARLHPTLGNTVTLRSSNEGYSGKPDVLAIGSSTGGPNALFKVLSGLKGIDIPIIITQHMPPTFTKILAEHIEQQTGLPAIEGAEGMPLVSGRVHVAPGGHHMLIVGTPSKAVIKIDDGPMESFCRPAVDPMLRSAIKVYGQKMLTVILTGMGQDGLNGSREVVAVGGRVIAQNEATSVVWGMPGAVSLAGLCTAVLPLDEIAPWLRKSALRLGSG
ncbi:MAG: chemotaxis-specific protein-glutamate methyltransferase CheB [Alphaproteobacteria bacterium]|nr:chemotaxis-specific protein-glutamate methyltransferase CheB [Alphaproteobacteria bacterium]